MVARCRVCEAAQILGFDEHAVGWEPLFWGVFERSRNAIGLVDQNSVYVAANGALCDLLDVPHETIVGARMNRFIAPSERSSAAAEWDLFWRTDEWVGERTLVTGKGSPVLVQYAGRVSEIGGRPIAVLVLLRRWSREQPARVIRVGELTDREREIVGLVALGLTAPEIAEQLVVSTHTVRTHMRNAMTKTGARTRAQLVALALTGGHPAATP